MQGHDEARQGAERAMETSAFNRIVHIAAGPLLGLALLACSAPASAQDATRAPAPETARPPTSPARTSVKPAASQTSAAPAPSAAGEHGARPSYRIDVIELTAQPAIAIRGSAVPEKLEAELAIVFPRLVAHAIGQGLELAGPPLVRYHVRSSKLIEYEAGLPVLKPGATSGDIQPIELPAGPAATTVHTGPYERLERAHAALDAWVRARGRRAAGPPWEVFLTNPLTERDAKKWRTKVFLPLVAAPR